MNIDLSRPVWCGGELRKNLVYDDHETDLITIFIVDYDNGQHWMKDGTPLGDWPPLTNVPPAYTVMQHSPFSSATPPVKPEVDKQGEEVKGEIDDKVLEMWYEHASGDMVYDQFKWAVTPLFTRIAELEAMVRELRNLTRTGEDEEGTIWVALNSLISRATHHDTLTRSKNLVP